MNAELSLEEILVQVEKLDKAAQITLFKNIALLLKKQSGESAMPLKLKELQGLGAEVWRDTEIDKYIDDERQW